MIQEDGKKFDFISSREQIERMVETARRKAIRKAAASGYDLVNEPDAGVRNDIILREFNALRDAHLNRRDRNAHDLARRTNPHKDWDTYSDGAKKYFLAQADLILAGQEFKAPPINQKEDTGLMTGDFVPVPMTDNSQADDLPDIDLDVDPERQLEKVFNDNVKETARALAKKNGVDYDSLSGEKKYALTQQALPMVKAGTYSTIIAEAKDLPDPALPFIELTSDEDEGHSGHSDHPHKGEVKGIGGYLVRQVSARINNLLHHVSDTSIHDRTTFESGTDDDYYTDDFFDDDQKS